MKKYKYFIGIDPGVKTGLAAKSGGKLKVVESHSILEAMDRVKELTEGIPPDELLVVVEDPHKRKWYGDNSKKVAKKMQGVGGVKRDLKIWVEFLEREQINYELIHPIKGGTKLDADMFEKVTGWKGQTNEHKRDAAMMIFGR